MRFSRVILSGLALWSFGALSGTPLQARDVFLTIGGGGSPTGNQVSLEKNVQLFGNYLDEKFGADAERVSFFADGDDEFRDLQYVDDSELPEVNERLASIFGQAGNLRYRYRSSQVSGVRGPATRENLQAWFESEGSSLVSGDRLFVYVTAHGSKGDRRSPNNTKLNLWNHQAVDVREFHRWLTAIDPQVPVVVVMVQCYSGGFADMLYPESEEKPLPVERPWCGFYATVPDRVAAGCTPDTREEEYFEYSTYFFEALRGKTRRGEPVHQPDYDGNGQISLDEAHAYVLINSRTIDISITTSDQYLRKLEFEIPEGSSKIEPTVSIEQLREAATPAQLAVLDGLITELGVDPVAPSTGAQALADRLIEEKKQQDDRRKEIGQELQGLANGLKNVVTHRWPELLNPWSPFAQRLMIDEADQIIAAIEQHDSIARFDQLRQEQKATGNESMEKDRRWVKCQRLLRLLETLALKQNLAQFGSLDEQETFARIEACERVTL